MTVTSGRKWSDALTLSGPLGLLARMCLGSSLWHSTRCVLTWKVSATPSGRSVFRLVPSMPRTNGNGSGLWPTPNARDHKDTGANVDWEKVAKKSKLAGAVMWPTPTQSDYRSPNMNPAKNGQVEPSSGHALPAKVGGQLNPTWVEWLMGYPTGWTDLGASATRSSRKSRKSSGA